MKKAKIISNFLLPLHIHVLLVIWKNPFLFVRSRLPCVEQDKIRDDDFSPIFFYDDDHTSLLHRNFDSTSLFSVYYSIKSQFEVTQTTSTWNCTKSLFLFEKKGWPVAFIESSNISFSMLQKALKREHCAKWSGKNFSIFHENTREINTQQRRKSSL